MATTFTVTIVKVFSLGDRKGVVADIAATGVPTAGGDVLSPSALGLELELNVITSLGASAPAGQTVGASLNWDPTDNKIVFLMAGAAATGAVALTGNANLVPNVRVFAIGKGSAVVNS